MNAYKKSEGVFIAEGTEKPLLNKQQQELLTILLLLATPLIIGVTIGYYMGTIDTLAQVKAGI